MKDSILFSMNELTKQKDVIEFAKNKSFSFAAKKAPVMVEITETLCVSKDTNVTYSFFDNMENAILEIALLCEDTMDFIYENGLKALGFSDEKILACNFYVLTATGKKKLLAANYFDKKNAIEELNTKTVVLQKPKEKMFSKSKIKFINAEQMNFDDFFEVQSETIQQNIETMKCEVVGIEKAMIELGKVNKWLKKALFLAREAK